MTAKSLHEFCNSIRGELSPLNYKDVIFPIAIIRQYEQKTKIENKINQLGKTIEEIINTTEEKKIYCRISKYIDNLPDEIKNILDYFKFREQIDHLCKKEKFKQIIRNFLKFEKEWNTKTFKQLFEFVIGRYFTSPEAGDHYTPRHAVDVLVNLIINETEEKNKKEIKILDMACGTGGILMSAHDKINVLKNDKKVILYGQEINKDAFSFCLIEMYFRNQNLKNIQLKDTILEDAFKDEKFDYVIANPPFGLSWSTNITSLYKPVVISESKKGGRFEMGIPSSSDMQWLFIQHGISKLKKDGKAAIFCSANVLTNGDKNSGENKIRKEILERDILSAIIQMPKGLFHNTGITTYVLIFDNNKEKRRKEKIQIIDASKLCKKLKKSNRYNNIYIDEDSLKEILIAFNKFESADRNISVVCQNKEFISVEYKWKAIINNKEEKDIDVFSFMECDEEAKKKIFDFIKIRDPKAKKETLKIISKNEIVKFLVAKFFYKEDDKKNFDDLLSETIKNWEDCKKMMDFLTFSDE